MNHTFLSVLEEHKARYPKMQPQDYGKLIFQSEFGPDHLNSGKQSIMSYLRKELLTVSKDSTPQFPESIGESLCRFPLSACLSDQAVEVLADLFILTSQKHSGTLEGVLDKLEQMIKLKIPGMEAWAAKWKKEGCPPVRHSKVYRDAYDPHYRLLQKDYAGYFPALIQVYHLMEQKKPVVIGIDGRCGSGKTHFAKLLASLYSCNVIHMDDFYLPPVARAKEWKNIPGGNIDFARLLRETLRPLSLGEEADYQPYDCIKGEIAEAHRIKPQPLTVVEGSYSHHSLLADTYDLKIFLTCSKSEQECRLKIREGSYFSVFKEQWIPMEENYLCHCNIESDSDIQIDTSEFFSYPPDIPI